MREERSKLSFFHVCGENVNYSGLHARDDKNPLKSAIYDRLEVFSFGTSMNEYGTLLYSRVNLEDKKIGLYWHRSFKSLQADPSFTFFNCT